MATYYPSAQVRLQMRLDDYSETEALAAKLSAGVTAPEIQTSATVAGRAAGIAENQAARVALNAQKNTLTAKDFAAQTAKLSSARAALQAAAIAGQPVTVPLPEGLLGGVEDQGNVIFATLPLRCSIERNNILDPDTSEITLDFKDVPIDPRIIRSALVTVTIGTVDAAEYKAGIINRELRASDGMLASIVERHGDEELRFTGTQSRFVGFVDEWTVELSESGDTVTIKARDISALLKDERLPAGLAINLNVPIVDGINALISADDDFGKPLFPSARGLQVVFGTPEAFAAGPLSDKGPVPGETVSRAHRTRGGKQARAARSGDANDSLWDHIVTTCQKLGLIPFMRNFVLFVSSPQTVYSQVENGRRMVYGRNLSELTFSRKLGGTAADTIEIRSFDPDIGRTRWARYPVLGNEPSSGIINLLGSPQPTASRPGKLSPTGKTSEQVKVFSVPRVADSGLLESIARQTFEQISRQEIEGSFKTDDLDSFKDDNDGHLLAADLLDLQAGQPITILFAPTTETAQGDPFQQTPKSSRRTTVTAQEMAAFTVSRRADYLRGLGMSQKTAERLAASAEQIPLANTFKVAYVNIDYDHEDGISLSVSFYNYITVREEAGLQPGPISLAAAQ